MIVKAGGGRPGLSAPQPGEGLIEIEKRLARSKRRRGTALGGRSVNLVGTGFIRRLLIRSPGDSRLATVHCS